MDELQKNEPEVVAKKTEAGTSPAIETKTEETTIGDALGKTENQTPKLVPEYALLKYKSDLKATQKALSDLQQSVENGAPKQEASRKVQALKEKYPDSSDFIDEFYSAMKAETDSEIESKVSEKTKPLTEREEAKRVDTIFGEQYEKTLAAMPEYKDVANKEVIKTLALDPRNANKTFAKILEEAYGHLITGKKTLETTRAGASKETIGEIDYKRAAKDTKYFQEVMADPQLKREYNENLAKRLQL